MPSSTMQTSRLGYEHASAARAVLATASTLVPVRTSTETNGHSPFVSGGGSISRRRRRVARRGRP